MRAATLVARSRSRMPKLLRLFALPDSPVAITRKGNDYQLSYLVDAAAGVYAQHDLKQIAGLPGARLTNQLHNARAGVPMLSKDDTDASVVRSGSFVRPIVNASAYGGSYGYSIAAGATVTFTSPAGVTALGLRSVRAVNGGYGKVTINGAATANLLPTAQAEVDAGRLVSTALVANGGTLNPTDRLMNFYSASTLVDDPLAIADGLGAGVQTVVVAVTGYKQATGSTDVRIFDSGYSYATPATRITDAGAVIMGTQAINSVASAWEWAYAWNGTFIGNVHGFERQDSLTITVDGVVSTPADLATVTGATIVVSRATSLLNPADNTTVIATIAYTYTLSRAGLRVRHVTTWATAATIGPGYPAMMPLDGTFDRGTTSALPTPLTLTAADGTFKGAGKADAVWMWQSAGKYAALMWIPTNPSPVNSWANAAGRLMCIEDRALSGGFKINKGYYTRLTGSGLFENVVNGTTWTGDVVFRLARFESGANAVLAAA